MFSIIENYFNRYETTEDVWRRYALAPRYVKRPVLGQLYAYYYFWDHQNGFRREDMDNIWEDIKWATKRGLLGYCGGYANDSHTIAVHISLPVDTLLDIIKDNLRQLGVKKIHLRIKERELIDYTRYHCSGSDENNFDFSELFLSKEFQELEEN